MADPERVNWREQLTGFRNAGIRSTLIYEGLVLSPHLLKIDFNFDPVLVVIAAIPGGIGIAAEFVSRRIRSMEKVGEEQATSTVQFPVVA